MDYQEKLLDIVNQCHYRLPEAKVFAVLEDFKAQCNQVLAYKNLCITYRYTVRSPETQNDDGGEIVLRGMDGHFISILASWYYGHPFHTFPLKLTFGEHSFLCTECEDIETAFIALLEHSVLKKYLLST